MSMHADTALGKPLVVNGNPRIVFGPQNARDAAVVSNFL